MAKFGVWYFEIALTAMWGTVIPDVASKGHMRGA
jgi:hypothetical protein